MQRLVLPVLCLSISLALAACQPLPQEAPYPGTPGGPDLVKCGGVPIRALIGRNVSEMPASGDWGTLRVIWPGMPVTEDYSVSRLNVEVDADGRITDLWCG